MNEKIKDLFINWGVYYKVDYISKRVLSILIGKYIEGEKAPLFGKMCQLIKDENFELCAIFKSMFDYIGINDDFNEWVVKERSKE